VSEKGNHAEQCYISRNYSWTGKSEAACKRRDMQKEACSLQMHEEREQGSATVEEETTRSTSEKS
jgi:hypothetical protein